VKGFFCIFRKIAKKLLPENKKFAFFLKFQMLRYLFLNSSDRLLSFESEDVFTDSLAQGWSNYGPRAAAGPPITLHILKHRVSNCGQQCKSICFCLSLVDLSTAAELSCKQRYKRANKMVWFNCYYCTTKHFSNLFCIDYVNRWSDSREFDPRVNKFGHPSPSATNSQVMADTNFKKHDGKHGMQ